MKTHLALACILAATACLAFVHTASATTTNFVPDILPVIWPLSNTSVAMNVTFALHDCTSTSGSCPTQSVSSGTTPTFTAAFRSAGAVPIVSLTRAMIPCGGAGGGYWCYNETIQYDQAVNGPYIAYGGMIMWSTGVSPANTWQGQSFVVTAKEVRLTSSINDADLPEGRAHANATWESQSHANSTWCATSACLPTNTAYESQSHANSTWDSQAHASAAWESQAHANATWCASGPSSGACAGNAFANATFERQSHANNTWEGQVHANASWCPLPACAANGDQLVSKSYADSTYEGQLHVNQTWESQAHANATWCPKTGCAFSGAISAPQLTVGGPVTAADLTVSGAMTTQTAWDPFVGMIVFGGITLVAVVVGVWGLQQRALVAKVALVAFLVIAALWAANQAVSSNTNSIRWVAVVIMSGFALLLAATAKPTRG